MDERISEFWARFRALNRDAPERPDAVFHFCDNQMDADTCAELVRAGRKLATATSLAELALAKEPLPKVGDLNVVTDWSGAPQAVIRTVSVEIRRFGDVDEDFARAEGEGDGSLAWWRQAHMAYYRRVLAGSDYAVNDDLQIACERFEVMLLA